MSVNRPDRMIVVVGTATDVGKTWVSASLLDSLRTSGLSVSVRKPVQSFVATDTMRDADHLAAATGEKVDDVCDPRHCYPLPMAPPMAAEALGLTVPSADDLVRSLAWPGDIDVGLIETVGGVRSPMCADADSGEFARLVDPDLVVVVADAGLGTIDAVRNAVATLAWTRPVVYLNRFDVNDDLHRRNAEWLRERDGVDLEHDLEQLRSRA